MKTPSLKPSKFIRSILVTSLLSIPLALPLLSPSALAQQNVDFANGVPVAPTGLANFPLAEGPFFYPTAEGMDIRVDIIARGIEYPTSMAFLPDGNMLISTRPGRIRLLEDGILNPAPVSGAPDTFYRGESGAVSAVHGYLDLILHPNFPDNQYIYLSYTKPLDTGERTMAIGRALWDGTALIDFTDIWEADPGIGGATRLAFNQQNQLFFTTSGVSPQDVNTHGGKVMRINDDGSIPSDNPFFTQAGAKTEVFSLGHRNALGLALHPGSGEMWQNENGPNGGDEVNIIKAGLNYGWPLVSLGRTYQGPWQSERPTHENYEPPVVYWMPAIAVSGMAFYTGDALPKWKGDLFVGALRTGEVPGTGHIERILFNEKMEELRRESLLVDLHQRVRDVRQGLDGLIYVATDEVDGAILRIQSAQ